MDLSRILKQALSSCVLHYCSQAKFRGFPLEESTRLEGLAKFVSATSLSLLVIYGIH